MAEGTPPTGEPPADPAAFATWFAARCDEAAATPPGEARQARLRALDGALKDLLAGIRGEGDPGRRRLRGEAGNRCKGLLEDLRARLRDEAPPALRAAPPLDVTMPGRRRPRGGAHPLTVVQADLERVFASLGFEVVDGPEVEDAAHNFDGLNIPPGHPARDPSDNFLLPGGWLLRSQTSPVQVRVLEETARAGGPRPIRILAPGRVYRPDTVDARHLYAFHQVEGLCVGEGISMADLKGTLAAFALSFYGGAASRFVPSYYPFTEPSAQVDVACPACGGAEKAARCATCGGEGWLELGGCGMVHPGVLRRAGWDPERWTGFAFGMGLERLAMRRWNIGDIRALVENDARFLGQFA